MSRRPESNKNTRTISYTRIPVYSYDNALITTLIRKARNLKVISRGSNGYRVLNSERVRSRCAASLEYVVDHLEQAAGREQRAVERRAVKIDRVAELCALDELRVATRRHLRERLGLVRLVKQTQLVARGASTLLCTIEKLNRLENRIYYTLHTKYSQKVQYSRKTIVNTHRNLMTTFEQPVVSKIIVDAFNSLRAFWMSATRVVQMSMAYYNCISFIYANRSLSSKCSA